MFKGKTFVVLNASGQGAVYSPVKGRGEAHGLIAGTPVAVGSDFLTQVDEKGMIGKLCGGKLKAANLQPGETRAMCTKCTEIMSSDAYADKVRETLAAGGIEISQATEGESPEGSGEKKAPAPKSDKKGEGSTESTPGGGVFVTVDGKCAREVVEKSGSVQLSVVNGRSRIEPVSGTISVNGDGAETGACPLCRREVELTGSGYIGTHYPSKIEPVKGEAKPLTERAVPDLQAQIAERTIAAEITTARKVAKKEGRVTTAEGIESSMVGKGSAKRAGSRRAAGLPVQESVGPVSTGMPGARGDQRTERSRGAALVKGRDAGTLASPVQVRTVGGSAPETDPASVAGEALRGHASTWDGGIGPARPDRMVTVEPKHGGQYGYFSAEEYRRLDRTAQRAYWRNVAKFEKQAKKARAAKQAKEIARGEAVPPAERRERRKGARVGSTMQGHVTEGQGGVRHGATPEESQAA